MRLVSSFVTHQTHHLETKTHLSLSEKCQTIQKQARLDAIAKISEHPLQTVIIAERTPRDITPGIYLSFQDIQRKAMPNVQGTTQISDSVLQTPIDSLLTRNRTYVLPGS